MTRYRIVHPAPGSFIDDDDRRDYGSETWADLLVTLRRVVAYYRRTGEDIAGLYVEAVAPTRNEA